MANILIDPVIVMTPSNNASKEDVETWIDNLDLWLTEALSSPFTWFYAKEAIEELLNDSRFPDTDRLFHWQRKYRLNSNISQLNAKLGTFFNSESNNDLSFHLEQMGYLVVTEPGSITIAPAQFAARWPDNIRSHMYELLATTCACKHNGEPLGQKMRIATFILNDVMNEIEVSVVILESLPDFARPDDNKINQTFQLLFTPEALLPLINVVECWDKGEIGIRYAIKQQYKRDWSSISPEPLLYELGTGFIGSVLERKDMTDLMLHRITRKMAEIIADRPNLLQYKPHWVREREEPHTPQLVRSSDNATAWRITITHDGAGWRMHYWRRVDSQGSVSIEFCNVQTKKDSVTMY